MGSSGTTSTIFDACSSRSSSIFASSRRSDSSCSSGDGCADDLSMSLTASSHASSGIAEIAACAARRSIAFAPSSDATAAAGAASAIPIRALTGFVSSSDWSRRTRAKRYLLCAGRTRDGGEGESWGHVDGRGLESRRGAVHMLLIIIITIGTSLFIES